MLVRILQFVIGALLAGGGGYLAWTHRTAGMNVFPPEAGMPWLVIAGVLGLCAGVVFLVSAVHPRPNTRAHAAAKAARRDEALGAAEAYYSQKDGGREAQRERAADSDWRSGNIAPPAAPVPPPVPEPVKMVEPVRVVAPVAPVVAAPAPAPAPVVPEKPQVVEQVVAPVEVPAPAPPPAPPQPVTPAAKPVATSAPPEPVVPPLFPSTATLAPIPAASEAPPAPAAAPAAAAEKPAAVEAKVAAPAGAFGAIRTALAAGHLDEAEKLLNAGRESAQGLELAELTGLAGDHAAAAGRLSNAKWLWRLSLKRFGELGAMDTPAAQAVAESLRVAG